MEAAHQVFTTAELLEAILLQLPAKDILLSQRVSRQWKATIEGSVKLQKALFFLPVGGAIQESISAKRYLNPLSDILKQYITASNKNDSAVLYHQLFSEQSASWKRMLLTQPPIKTLKVLPWLGNARALITRVGGTSMLDFFVDCKQVSNKTGNLFDLTPLTINLGGARRLKSNAQLENLPK